MPSRLLHSLSRKDTSSPTAKAIGPSITLQSMKRTTSFAFMDSQSMRSGIWVSTVGSGEYEAKIQVSVRRFQKCSSVRAACRESQSPTIWLRRNRKRGGRVTKGDKAIHLLTQMFTRSESHLRFLGEICGVRPARPLKTSRSTRANHYCIRLRERLRRECRFGLTTRPILRSLRARALVAAADHAHMHRTLPKLEANQVRKRSTLRANAARCREFRCAP